MTTFVIESRPACPADAAEIAAVHDEAWRNAYRGIIPGGALERMIERRGARWWENAIARGSRVIVLSAGEEIAGYASFGRNRAATLPVDGEIYELYMHPAYQGLGLGKTLFAACRTDMAARFPGGFAVWALADNERACDFYLAAGGAAAARGSESFGDIALDKIAFVWSKTQASS